MRQIRLGSVVISAIAYLTVSACSSEKNSSGVAAISTESTPAIESVNAASTAEDITLQYRTAINNYIQKMPCTELRLSVFGNYPYLAKKGLFDYDDTSYEDLRKLVKSGILTKTEEKGGPGSQMLQPHYKHTINEKYSPYITAKGSNSVNSLNICLTGANVSEILNHTLPNAENKVTVTYNWNSPNLTPIAKELSTKLNDFQMSGEGQIELILTANGWMPSDNFKRN